MQNIILLFLLNCYIGMIVFILGKNRGNIPYTWFHMITIVLLGVISLIILGLCFFEDKLSKRLKEITTDTPIKESITFLTIAYIVVGIHYGSNDIKFIIPAIIIAFLIRWILIRINENKKS